MLITITTKKIIYSSRDSYYKFQWGLDTRRTVQITNRVRWGHYKARPKHGMNRSTGSSGSAGQLRDPSGTSERSVGNFEGPLKAVDLYAFSVNPLIIL